MVKRVSTLFALCALVISASVIAAAGNTPSKQKFFEKALPDERAPYDKNVRYVPLPPDPPSMRPLAGVYTGLSGYFDYHWNAGSGAYIRVDKSDPTGRKIHVIFMTASDSTAPTGSTRRTSYAYSTDGGGTWNSFSNLTVPSRRSGYPSLDMLQGATQGTIIANHNDPGTGLSSGVFIDSPTGGGAFAELNVPAPIAAGADEPIWPHVAGAADGSVIMNASQSTAGIDHHTRSSDFSTWSAWEAASPQASAGIPTEANSTNRVGSIINTIYNADNGLYWLESTNNGVTWPAAGTEIYSVNRIVGPDTFSYTLSADFLYSGNNPFVAFAEANIGANAPTDSAQITFWSQVRGFKVAASKVNTPNIVAFENRPTFNTITLDMPSIGLSGSTIAIAYHGMIKNDTSASGYDNCDIFLVYSNNSGLTWSTPRNITNTRGKDERFVSVSPWNEPGKVNLVWQEDPEAGGNIIGDPGALVARTRQVFSKETITGVEEQGGVPVAFTLEQNYPNPFNPATMIRFSLLSTSNVSLKVYNTLGQEVASLVDDVMPAGNYEADFTASNLASGVYHYTLRAGQFTDTKKMVLLK